MGRNVRRTEYVCVGNKETGGRGTGPGQGQRALIPTAASLWRRGRSRCRVAGVRTRAAEYGMNDDLRCTNPVVSVKP